jgi:hypothetical protein
MEKHMNKRNVVLSFAAGLLGGTISHYVSPQLVRAQSQAPKELRAESFLLVNEKGIVLGTLSDEGGRPSLRLFDERGREIWRAGGRTDVPTALQGRTGVPAALLGR